MLQLRPDQISVYSGRNTRGGQFPIYQYLKIGRWKLYVCYVLKNTVQECTITIILVLKNTQTIPKSLTN